ncbi:helix-turn-helix domain-containing protein [Paremcibacter congregatus]|uniref:helix-turn-helix domain-containing protein n=1 Tax=Paremcibacter congregatus TaxID=2043170 RepID=UPI001120EF77|nr:helix-turn-helix domain-containing protein [Paremcibacter congregatus]QDE27277.1 hypothetical protein FIV45_08255 [Paremcibacter congregatus]
MRTLLNTLNHLPARDLRQLTKLINNLAQSVERLAVDAEQREVQVKKTEQRDLRKSEKLMLQKLKLQRAIMTRYQAGYSIEHIATVLDYHPKTIARYIRKFQTDLTILKEIDHNVTRRKIELAKGMLKRGDRRDQVIRKLHISGYYVPLNPAA